MASSSPKSPSNKKDAFKGWWILLLLFCLFLLVLLGVIFMRSRNKDLIMNNMRRPVAV